MMDATQKEAAHRAASDAELIAWVDEHDNLLGTLVRSDLRRRGLIGRCTFIFLFNSAGELCVHRRTLSKAMYPGFWDTAAGGMVAAVRATPIRRSVSWKKSSALRAWRWSSMTISTLRMATAGSGANPTLLSGMARCACNRKR